MLHCPRCSTPLDVTSEVDEIAAATAAAATSRLTHPAAVSTTPATSTASKPSCPAGPLCPHQAATAGVLLPPSAAATPSSTAANYLSGGGILSPTPLATAAASPGNLQQRLESPPAKLLYSTQLCPLTEASRQAGGCQAAAAAAPVTTSPPHQPQCCDNIMISQPQHHHHPHHLHQHQHPHQHLHLQPSLAAVTTNSSCQQLLFSAPQQQQQQQQQPFLALMTPQLLTSTIQQHPTLSFQPSLGISTMCQPSTPAIVVGSTGNPFFSPLQHQQQQQQQQLYGNLPHYDNVNPHWGLQQPPSRASSIHSNHSSLNSSFLPPRFSPPAPSPPQQPVVNIQDVLQTNKEQLKRCGWYYEGLRWDESAELLNHTRPGTFLVRDSADSRFLYSLSVQRSGAEGPTSVRIHFQAGKFRLDADNKIINLMPEFDSVIALISHYVVANEEEEEDKEKHAQKTPPNAPQNGENGHQVWVDSVGQLSSPIVLRQPLYKGVPRLAHAARLAVNERLLRADRGAGRIGELELPKKLEEYLVQYPHSV